MNSDTDYESTSNIYAIFHLNLNFSSIDEHDHSEIVNRCYWPLLNIIEEDHLPLAIELSVYTLEKIAQVDLGWIETFKALLLKNKCELLACGDSQIIGPLVPYEVNKANLELGKSGYLNWLNIKPKIAYVNEQAFSAGLFDVYLDCGFDTVVVEWENPYSHNTEWHQDTAKQPQRVYTATGRTINVIWNKAIAFQKLQRYAHGEYTQDEYLEYIFSLRAEGHRSLCIYGNDAEVFDYRPGRFKTEVCSEHNEVGRLRDLFLYLKDRSDYSWVMPSELIPSDSSTLASSPLTATNAAYPISVKKQAKYNITRWAVSGRNDLALNTTCFQQFKIILEKGPKPPHGQKLISKRDSPSNFDESWRELCRSWASDLRTHLTDTRYVLVNEKSRGYKLTSSLDTTKNLQPEKELPKTINYVKHKHLLEIHTSQIQLDLNCYRGLSIASLGFKKHEFKPVCGTITQGYFDHILYGADFYSNHMVMERYRERDRVTDLCKTKFEVYSNNEETVISCFLPSVNGGLTKWYKISGDQLTCGYRFKSHERPECSLRLGFITLSDTHERCWYAAHFGSPTLEYFHAQNDFDHGAPVSSITSSTNAISATQGVCHFGSGEQGVQLQWDQSQCAPILMASSKLINNKFLNRLWFSLVESDETLKTNGELLDFEYTISPIKSPVIS